MRVRRLRDDEAGVSLLETMIALIVFGVGVLGLAASGLVASQQMKTSRADTRAWTAARYQLETIRAQGYDAVTAGSATVLGYPMSWDVLGTDPKKVILVVQAENWRGDVLPDTFVTYIADWTP